MHDKSEAGKHDILGKPTNKLLSSLRLLEIEGCVEVDTDEEIGGVAIVDEIMWPSPRRFSFSLVPLLTPDGFLRAPSLKVFDLGLRLAW